jgi:adenosine deaminase
MDWTILPKVELHLHLDCSLSYEVVSRIDPSITLEAFEADFVAPPKCEDLSDFLTRARSFYPLLQAEENLQLTVLDLFAQLHRDHVVYAEIRFAPLLHTDNGLSPHRVVECVEEATAEGAWNTGIDARLILCALRYHSPDQSMETVKLVEAFRGSRVAGFDIAAEAPGDVITPHQPAFDYAREHGIPFTAHAGETRGVANVWDTVRAFRPARLGHGVSSVEDPELIAYLRHHRIHLEACPTSNVQTDCYYAYGDHPIDRLLRANVSVSVNTDTRTINNVTLSEEYEKLHDTFGWGLTEFLECNRNALKAAFIPKEERSALLTRLGAGYPAPV